MFACESKLASRSSRKATRWSRLYLLSRPRSHGHMPRSRGRMPSLVGDCGQVLQVLGWALTRIRNLSLVLHWQPRNMNGAGLCVEQSRKLVV